MSKFRCYKCNATYQDKPTWCIHCSSSWVGPAFDRTPTRLDSPEFTTAAELWERNFDIEQNKSYPMIEVGNHALIFVYGRGGSGKSTFATLWVKGVKSLYLSEEEGFQESLQARVIRCGLKGDKTVFAKGASVDHVVESIRALRPRWIVVDSVQATCFTADNLRSLADLPQLRGVIAVSHATKDGQEKGSSAYRHEADVVIRVDDMTWSMEKSRYQALIDGEVWPKKEERTHVEG